MMALCQDDCMFCEMSRCATLYKLNIYFLSGMHWKVITGTVQAGSGNYAAHCWCRWRWWLALPAATHISNPFNFIFMYFYGTFDYSYSMNSSTLIYKSKKMLYSALQSPFSTVFQRQFLWKVLQQVIIV